MFERFTKDARRTVEEARHEAQAAGSPTLEAEHLLLALARRPHPVLAVEDVDVARVEEALAHERAASLAAAGVEWDVDARPTRAEPRFAASAKLALERSLPAAIARRDRRLTSDHILLGILEADAGTVPRALELAGVDRRALAESV